MLSSEDQLATASSLRDTGGKRPIGNWQSTIFYSAPSDDIIDCAYSPAGNSSERHKEPLGMYGTIGIVTGGGDAPGLNAVIRAVVKTATCEHGMRVIGIEDGFEGLLGATRTRLLSTADVRGLLPRGGTILGTRNRGHFAERTKDGQKVAVEKVYEEAINNMRILGIDALVVLGGEGTLGI